MRSIFTQRRKTLRTRSAGSPRRTARRARDAIARAGARRHAPAGDAATRRTGAACGCFSFADLMRCAIVCALFPVPDGCPSSRPGRACDGGAPPRAGDLPSAPGHGCRLRGPRASDDWGRQCRSGDRHQQLADGDLTDDRLHGAPPLEIIPLGGVGEFGMNMMVIACGDTAILVDAGVMFPEPELLGVDLIIPDLRQLQQLQDRGARADARPRGSHRRRAARDRRACRGRSTARRSRWRCVETKLDERATTPSRKRLVRVRPRERDHGRRRSRSSSSASRTAFPTAWRSRSRRRMA